MQGATKLQTTLERELENIKHRITQAREKASMLEHEALRFQNLLNDISKRSFSEREKVSSGKQGRHGPH